VAGCAGLSSSLEHPETSAEPHIAVPAHGPRDWDEHPDITLIESRFRHSGWAHNRRRVFAALKDAGVGHRRLERFANCGCNAWLATRGEELVIVADHCHDRWCEPCQVARRAMLRAEVFLRVRNAQGGRMLTLTLRTLTGQKLPDILCRLKDAFRRLRQRQWWKEHVKGGVACLEVKRGKRGNWHPHLHVVCVGQPVRHADLSREWLAATGDSSIVWVTPINGDEKSCHDAAAYVVKYATKPMSMSSLTHTDLVAAMLALKGKKLITPIGDWEGIGKEEPDEASRVTNICPLDCLHEPQHARWREAAVRKWPSLAQFLPHPTSSDEEFVP